MRKCKLTSAKHRAGDPNLRIVKSKTLNRVAVCQLGGPTVRAAFQLTTMIVAMLAIVGT